MGEIGIASTNKKDKLNSRLEALNRELDSIYDVIDKEEAKAERIRNEILITMRQISTNNSFDKE